MDMGLKEYTNLYLEKVYRSTRSALYSSTEDDALFLAEKQADDSMNTQSIDIR